MASLQVLLFALSHPRLLHAVPACRTFACLSLCVPAHTAFSKSLQRKNSSMKVEQGSYTHCTDLFWLTTKCTVITSCICTCLALLYPTLVVNREGVQLIRHRMFVFGGMGRDGSCLQVLTLSSGSFLASAQPMMHAELEMANYVQSNFQCLSYPGSLVN